MKFPAALVFLAAIALAATAHAYGPIGHQIVGAIADERLAGTPTGRKIASLLQGFTLEKAAVIPDEIKGWDKNGVDAPDIFRYRSRPRVDAELADFWRANPPTRDRSSATPSHHWFHYTDVPVLNAQNYADGQAGRSQWDIVQMIRYCVEVLKGDIPADNPRKITKAVAIILLAHLVGDIHQPLHVGAQFFNEAGQPVDPDKDGAGLENQGGNTINFKFSPELAEKLGARDAKLHGFWDGKTVELNLPLLPKEMPKEERRARTHQAKRALVMEMAKTEPPGWRLPVDAGLEQYGEEWADEILPIAREAHERLEFSRIRRVEDEHGHALAVGDAEERPAADGIPYDEWSARIVREQLHKAGWRLADLLEKTLQ
jgi:hypothetical protein